METKYPPFMNALEVAELLRVSQETVKRHARAGKLPTVSGLRSWRFPRDQLFAVLAGKHDRKIDDE